MIADQRVVTWKVGDGDLGLIRGQEDPVRTRNSRSGGEVELRKTTRGISWERGGGYKHKLSLGG